MTERPETDQPVFKVITPDATPEQVAAVVAVLSAMGGGEEQAAPKSEWASHVRKLRTPLHHGRGGWRASSMPR